MILPVPLPDEMLCSLLTRLCQINGICDFREFSSRYFGGPSSASFVDAQIDLPEFCIRIDHVYGKSSTVVESLTVLGAQVRLGALGASILDEIQSGVIKPSLGELSFFDNTGLSYCTACRHHDISKYGFSYWHRLHQIPAVIFCPVHGIPLDRARFKRVRLHQTFPIPSDFDSHDSSLGWACSTETLNPWLGVANMVREFLEVQTTFDIEDVNDALLDELRERRLFTAGGRIRQDNFNSFCLDCFIGEGGAIQDAKRKRALELVIRKLDNPYSEVSFWKVVLVFVLFGNWKAFEEKCKWTQVFRASHNPPLPSNHDISSESELESFHRKICIDYLYEHPGCTRFDFTKAKYRSFRWLLHHDKRWLDEQLPIPLQNMKQLELFGV